MKHPIFSLTALCAAGTAFSLTSCELCHRVGHNISNYRPLLAPVPAGEGAELAGTGEKAPVGGAGAHANRSLYAWDGDDVPGRVAMTIDLSEQKAHIRKGGRSVGWTYVATGKSGFRTPSGSFAIREKLRHKISNSWGVVVNRHGSTIDSDARSGREAVPRGGRFVGAPMPFWMRVTGGIGMHAGYIPNPGSPASHGCIRLPRYMAEKLFAVTDVGSSVRIVP